MGLIQKNTIILKSLSYGIFEKQTAQQEKYLYYTKQTNKTINSHLYQVK